MTSFSFIKQKLSTLANRSTMSSSASFIKPPYKVSVVGSGNWGTTIAKIVAENCSLTPDLFYRDVTVWVREEQVNGRNLTEIINTEHENVRYLPNIKLPNNLIAEPNIEKAVKGSGIIIFNLPHQFLVSVCKQLKGHVEPKARAISCIKGFKITSNDVYLFSDVIKEELGIHCGVLSGANIANEVAMEKFSETTIAYNKPEDYFKGDIDRYTIKKLFHRPYFHVQYVEDVAGVSIGGALKNVIAIAAGFIEGKEWGDNAKAAIMRRGIKEMIKFSKIFFPKTDIYTLTTESAGIADLITSCSNGRNFRVGKEVARTGKPIEQIEKDLLNGQLAQGIVTCNEIHKLLQNRKIQQEFPLFEITWNIVQGNIDVDEILKILYHAD